MTATPRQNCERTGRERGCGSNLQIVKQRMSWATATGNSSYKSFSSDVFTESGQKPTSTHPLWRPDKSWRILAVTRYKQVGQSGLAMRFVRAFFLWWPRNTMLLSESRFLKHDFMVLVKVLGISKQNWTFHHLWQQSSTLSTVTSLVSIYVVSANQLRSKTINHLFITSVNF